MRSTRVGSVSQRFFSRFTIDEKTKCWNWNGALTSYGYGVIAGEINGKRYVPKGQQMLAHRVSWILHYGDIPDGDGAHGMVVMHICDNRGCVNPKHLRLGSQSENVKDMIVKGRKVSGTPSGVQHWGSSIKDQSVIDLICSTTGNTKALAEQYGVAESTIKRIRRRNGASSHDAEKFSNHRLSQEAIDHIRSTKPGTRGLGKLYGVGKTTISNIRKGLTYAVRKT